MNPEEWRPVPGWDGMYEVSSLGRVRSLARVVARSDGRTQTFPAKLRKACPVNGGYLAVHLCRNGKPQSFPIHRLVALAFLGPPPPQMEVCHGDGDRRNNELSSLRWGSHHDNLMDRLAHGTDNRGEKHNMVKLCEEDVLAIRAAHAAGGVTHADLARRHGVSTSLIQLIIARRRWGWLETQEVVA